MHIINTCNRIMELFSDGFDICVWRKYAAQISAELPLKCEDDAAEYNFEKDVLPVISAALNADKIDLTNQSFGSVIKTLQDNMSRLFETEPDIDIVIYLGLCNGAGWATTLNGRPTVLLGLEKIIELGWYDERNMRALILHEIGHLWHKLNGSYDIPTFTKRRKALQQLYCEGVAMVCEHILCAENFYHQDKDGWLTWCYENEICIKREFLRRLESGESVQDFFGDWRSFEGHSDVGYFLGCRFVMFMLKKHTLKEIANMNYGTLNKAFTAFVHEDCAPMNFRIDFKYLDKTAFSEVSVQLFDILADNMSIVAPTGNVRAEDYQCWFGSVKDGLKRNERQIVLIEDSGFLIGFFQYYVNSKSFMMEECQLIPQYQNKGIFNRLCSFLLPKINSNPKYVEAYANLSNKRSIAVLEKLGLQKVGLNRNGNSYHFKCDFTQLKKRCGLS